MLVFTLTEEDTFTQMIAQGTTRNNDEVKYVVNSMLRVGNGKKMMSCRRIRWVEFEVMFYEVRQDETG